jgi:hypothetical protein
MYNSTSYAVDVHVSSTRGGVTCVHLQVTAHGSLVMLLVPIAFVTSLVSTLCKVQLMLLRGQRPTPTTSAGSGFATTCDIYGCEEEPVQR